MANCTTRVATVMESGPEGLVLRLEREAEDDAASQGCRSCAMKSLCRGRDDGSFAVTVPADVAYAVGDRVSVRYGQANAALAAVVMFAPALIGLFVGGFSAQRLFGGDGAFLAGCLVGLAVGVGATFLANRWLDALKPEAFVVGKIEG